MKTRSHLGLRAIAMGAAALLFAAASPAQAQKAAAGASGMRAVDITDARGFQQPVVAAIVQIPAGWQPRGGVQWDRTTNCVGNQVRFEWLAASPDGAQAFEIMHGYHWQVQGTQIQMNPCPVNPFDSARAFLAAVVQQRRPGARILDYRSVPSAAQTAPLPAGMRLRQDAGELLVAYQKDGVEYRESFKTQVNFTELQGNVMGGTSMVFAQRAPNGQLDFSLSTRISSSLKPNPHWMELAKQSTGAAGQRFSSAQSRAISNWHAGEMARINAKGAADRAAIRAQTSREIGQIHSDTNRSTQATNDAMHRRSLEATDEYNTYSGQGGEPVRSSIHGGERVLQHPGGGYSSTNDPYYNPAGSRELERVR